MSLIKIGSRGSELALFQTNLVKTAIENLGYTCEIEVIKTRGDIDQRDFVTIQGDGFFTKEIERQLLEGNIHIAVHSAKDLPSLTHRDLPWVAFGEREDPRDILIYKRGHEIKKIGTSSPRRLHQMQEYFPQAEILPLRGNVPTRIQKLRDGNYDAIVLAKAGFNRLQIQLGADLEFKDIDATTSPCQGVLAVQGHHKYLWLLEKIANTQLTEIAYGEKEVLRLLGGGCHLAVGVNLDKKEFCFFDDSSAYSVKSSAVNNQFMNEIISTLSDNFCQPKVILTQSLSHQLKVAHLFKRFGLGVQAWPLMDAQSVLVPEDLSDERLKEVLVFTSQYGARIYLMDYLSRHHNLDIFKKKQIYAIGEATKAALEAFGLSNIKMPTSADSVTTANELKSLQEKITYLGHRQSNFRKLLKTDFIEVYQTIYCSHFWRNFQPKAGDNIVFCSPSSVRTAIDLLSLSTLKELNIYAFGPTTSNSLHEQGLRHQMNPVSGSWKEMAQMIRGNI